jgi:thiamine pyrophosphate-dependent acetolactate synthase large subunit-like protein
MSHSNAISRKSLKIHSAEMADSVLRPAETDLQKLAAMIEGAKSVAIFGGDGCRDARDEVIALATKLKAPVGYSFRGKQWLEHDNPNAVGMTGLLGYGGAYKAIHDADLLLMLGTDFPFTEFLPGRDVKKVQIDRNAKHIGRRRRRLRRSCRTSPQRARRVCSKSVLAKRGCSKSC